jgi:uncharacterized repeat protein (TIGR02543 family)
MKTKRSLPKRLSGTTRVSGILLLALALALVAASVASAKPFAYVSNFGSGTVSVLDAGANSTCAAPCVVKTVAVGSLPGGVAVNRAGTFAYVANKGDGTVSVIRTSDNTVVGGPIPVGMDPWGVAVSEDGTRVYVAMNMAVAWIDVANGNTVHTIPNVGGSLNGIAVDGTTLYVTDSSSGSVLVVDTTLPNGSGGLGRVVATVPVGAAPFSNPLGIVVDPTPGAKRVYVVDVFADPQDGSTLEVSVIDPTQLAAAPVTVRIDVGATPGGIALSPDRSLLYVANDVRDGYTVLSTQPLAVLNHVVGLGIAPVGIATDSTGRRVFVGNLGSGTVSVVDTVANTVNHVPVGAVPFVFGAFVTDGPTVQHTLTVTSSPAAGGTITPAGGTFDQGTVVTLSVTPNPGYQFVGWSGGGCSGTNACNVTMDGPKTVTAMFTLNQYPLTVTSSPAAGGTITPPGGMFNHGATVTLSVTPNPGYQFAGWSGGGCSGTNACNVTMDGPKAVTAMFTLRQYVLTVTSSPAAGGTITPPGGTFNHGTTVTLSVTPNPGYQFVGWSGGGCSGTNACNVTMDGPKAVTATFTQLLYTLTLTATPDAGGTIDAGQVGVLAATPAAVGGNFPPGTVVRLTPSPNPGYQFSGWSGACSGTVVPCTVTMDGPKTVTARFTATPPPPTTCDEKIEDLRKKVAAHKQPWARNHQLKAALRLYSAAQAELARARAKVGENDKRYVRAKKEFNNGKAALCAGRYWHAHHELWEAWARAHEILKRHHHRH